MKREDFVPLQFYLGSASKTRYQYIGPDPLRDTCGYFYLERDAAVVTRHYSIMLPPARSGKVWVTIVQNSYGEIYPIGSSSDAKPEYVSTLRVLSQFQVDWEEEVK